MKMTTAELLQAAKNELIEHGWQQGMFGNFREPAVTRCAIGALHRMEYAHNIENWHSKAYHFLVQATGDYTAIALWNDTPGRTFNDVMDLYDRAIALAKEEEAAQ